MVITGFSDRKKTKFNLVPVMKFMFSFRRNKTEVKEKFPVFLGASAFFCLKCAALGSFNYWRQMDLSVFVSQLRMEIFFQITEFNVQCKMGRGIITHLEFVH